MMLDAAAIFVLSLLVGTVAILVGARLVVDTDAGVANATFAALVGALVWAGSSLLVDVLPVTTDWLPLFGLVLMLVAWVAIINWRYPGGVGPALAIGVVAWIVAVAIVFGLSAVGLITPEAVGLPVDWLEG